MPACFVVGCPNSNRNSVTSFHRIPRQFTLEWLSLIGRHPLVNIFNQRVCAEHFINEDFHNAGDTKRLKEGILPSKQLPPCPLHLPHKGVEEHAESNAEDATSRLSSIGMSCYDTLKSNSSRYVQYHVPEGSIKLEFNEDNNTDNSEDISEEDSQKQLEQLVKAIHSYSTTPEKVVHQLKNERHRVEGLKVKYQIERRKRIKLSRQSRILKQELEELKIKCANIS